MELKWFGTASIAITEKANSLLFDPFCSWHPKNTDSDLSKFTTYNTIFITHGHFDHLIDVPALLTANKQAVVHCHEVPANTLVRKGVNKNQIRVIKPGDSLDIGPFNIKVLKGRHIVFDRKLILKTLLNVRMLRYFNNLRKLVPASKEYREGQTLVYEITVNEKKLLHLGSLSFDESETYPQGVEVMTIPFQGRSDLAEYVIPLINQIKPQSLYLHHYDDSFPPISSAVHTQQFISKAAKLYPDINVILPVVGESRTVF
ncbi:MAG: MBL fold metallo-hydrolase [Syntrophomonadales bacterium]